MPIESVKQWFFLEHEFWHKSCPSVWLDFITANATALINYTFTGPYYPHPPNPPPLPLVLLHFHWHCSIAVGIHQPGFPLLYCIPHSIPSFFIQCFTLEMYTPQSQLALGNLELPCIHSILHCALHSSIAPHTCILLHRIGAAPSMSALLGLNLYLPISFDAFSSSFALHSSTFHSFTLHFSTLHSSTLHHFTLHFSTLHSSTLHSSTLHSSTMHFTTLHFPSAAPLFLVVLFLSSGICHISFQIPFWFLVSDHLIPTSVRYYKLSEITLESIPPTCQTQIICQYKKCLQLNWSVDNWYVSTIIGPYNIGDLLDDIDGIID